MTLIQLETRRDELHDERKKKSFFEVLALGC